MRCFARACALLGLVWLAAESAAPSDGPPPLMIVFDLRVEDAKGRPVSDLKAAELVVVQDHVPQAISQFTPKELPGHYEITYAPASGKAGLVTVMLKRLGTVARGGDGGGLKPRVVVPPSALAFELGRVLEARPDADDFRTLASVMHFEAAADGVHHTFAIEIPRGALAAPGVPVDRVQIFARVADDQGRLVKQFDIERSLGSASPTQSLIQRMVWTGQLHLRAGRYVLDTVVREPRSGRASVRRVAFEARDASPGLGLSSVALLHPMDSLTVRDQGRETDDPFLLDGEPLMPALDLQTSAAPGVKVEFFTIVYPDGARPDAVSLTLELVRDGKVVATVPLAAPTPDERGQVRYAGGMATRTLAPADYRLRLVARQGDAQASEETTFSVRSEASAAPVRIAAQPDAVRQPDLPEIDAARMLLVRQEVAQAIQILKEADAKTSGARADVAILLAIAYLRGGAHKDAEATARRAVELTKGTPSQAEALRVLGRALAAAEPKPVRGDSEKLRAAEQTFRQALAGSPGDESAQIALGETLLRLDRGEEARAPIGALQGQPGLSPGGLERTKQLLRSSRCATEGCLPSLAFVTADGQHRTTEDLSGKAVLLSFWASWCKPCIEALPDLRRLHARYQHEPFVMIGVSVDSDASAAKSFVQQHQLEWAQAVEGGSGSLGASAAAQGIPFELVFDHEGVVVGRSRGWSSQSSRDLAAMVGDVVGKARKAQAKAAQP
jgi:thiol-disulfide isomerase/thioredoxin